MVYVFYSIFIIFVTSVICDNDISEENKLPGTADWWYPNDGREMSGPEGYSTQFSVKPGDKIIFKISSHSETLSVKIFRLGYYQGIGARQYAKFHLDSINGFGQPKCNFDLRWKLVDCSNWKETISWNIPNFVTTGVYVALPYVTELNSTVTYGNYIPFVVRQPNPVKGSDILFKTSDYTWVAYNKYSHWNLYRGNFSFTFDTRAYKVSYNRPWNNRLPRLKGGQHQNFVLGSEFPMLFWLEKHSYDVSYASCYDVERYYVTNQITSKYKIFLSIGHDEYWTHMLKQSFQYAREIGIHLIFFSGNEIFWQIRLEHLSANFSAWSATSAVAYGNWLSPYHQMVQLNTLEHSNSLPTSAQPSHSVQNMLAEPRIVVCFKESIDGGIVRKSSKRLRRLDVEQHHSSSNSNIYRASNDLNMFHPLSLSSVTSLVESLAGKSYLPTSSSLVLSNPYEYNKRYHEFEREEFWTGTFIDPRHRIPNPPHSLTGQYFLVNGPRADSLTIPASYNHLNLWKHTTFYKSSTPHTTFPGILGYEVDVYKDDCFRPHGLVSFSDTTLNATSMLMENFGATYKGSGIVHHRLTWYRYVLRSNLQRKSANVLPSEITSKPVSSLVFGAGTIQWSWALSSFHDQDLTTKSIDRDLQQATLNIFAAMNVFPHQLRKDVEVSPDLVMPSKPTDILPPKSHITSHAHNDIVYFSNLTTTRAMENAFIEIRGTAVDFSADNDGLVAAVEISFDFGETWLVAQGRDEWSFKYHLVDSRKPRCTMSDFVSDLRNIRHQYNLDGTIKDNVKMSASNQLPDLKSMPLTIISRAVDDSGWTEFVPDSATAAATIIAAATTTHVVAGHDQASSRSLASSPTPLVGPKKKGKRRSRTLSPLRYITRAMSSTFQKPSKRKSNPSSGTSTTTSPKSDSEIWSQLPSNMLTIQIVILPSK